MPADVHNLARKLMADEDLRAIYEWARCKLGPAIVEGIALEERLRFRYAANSLLPSVPTLYYICEMQCDGLVREASWSTDLERDH